MPRNPSTDTYVVDDLAYPIVTMERYDIRPIPRNGSATIPKPKTRTHLI
ncbi:MAG: hypothetical protein HYT87_10175 [Nitrospirae bacterium]|nr:hypothetical protein [Nitrospirota bacterium]